MFSASGATNMSRSSVKRASPCTFSATAPKTAYRTPDSSSARSTAWSRSKSTNSA